MVDTLASLLFIKVSPGCLCVVLFFFVLFISDLPLHVTKYFTVDYNSIVNCEIFADDITLAVYDTYPVSVENEFQKSTKVVSVWCSKK